jgi:dolichol-phosphate mannosyltransferase
MSDKPLVSVVVPTFNEEGNIALLLIEIDQTLRDVAYEVIVIDDGDDKTAEIAFESPRTKVYRGKAKGLGQAILDGIQHSQGDVVVVMDADLSHSPFDIPRLLKPILQYGYDMAIGSRYVKGGDISKWGKRRGISSRISATMMFPIFGVRDANSGFFAFRKSVIGGVKLRATSWKMMMEVLVKGKVNKKIEIPIKFNDRQYGKSKNNFAQKLLQAKHMFYLVVYKCRRYISFALVGGVGNIPHFLILWLLTDYAHVWYVWSNMAAILFAGTQNYLVNHIFTFRKDRANNHNLLYGWTKFLVVMAIGDFGVQTGVAFVLTQYLHIFYVLSVFLATIVSGLFKFLIVKRIIWGKWGKQNVALKANNNELA